MTIVADKPKKQTADLPFPPNKPVAKPGAMAFSVVCLAIVLQNPLKTDLLGELKAVHRALSRATSHRPLLNSVSLKFSRTTAGHPPEVSHIGLHASYSADEGLNELLPVLGKGGTGGESRIARSQKKGSYRL